MRYDAVIVGSGPSAFAARLGLGDMNVLVIDVGWPHPKHTKDLMHGPGHGPCPADLADQFILGHKLESLHNVAGAYLSPKLKSPLMRFITDGWKALTPLVQDGFDGQLTLARGGFANAWGAGAYEFNDVDLEGFPIARRELESAYAMLSKRIGVSGARDDLYADFGTTSELQAPLELSSAIRRLLARYEKNRSRFAREGIKIGEARLAVLSKPLGQRQEHHRRNLEFFRPDLESVFNPAPEFQRWSTEGSIDYRDGHLVRRFAESTDGITVSCQRLGDGQTIEFEARSLILAAGAINSARIALASRNDREAKLPLLDNPISYVPFLDLLQLGRRFEPGVFAGAQLNLIFDYAGQRLQGSLYDLFGVLRSDLLFDFPLDARSALAAGGDLLSAMMIVQFFYPDRPHPNNFLSLGEGGALRIHRGANTERGSAERALIRLMRRVGLVSAPVLCKYPAPGNSFHYAGTLPMRERPGQYETDPMGRLNPYRNVFVADSATFPRLPAKNHTFTMMANALRIAEGVRTAMTA
jgi:choline dehydrogenase-like flavoprotein